MSADKTGADLEPPPEDAPIEAAIDTATRPADAAPLLRDPRLVAFFISRTLSSFASQMQAVAVGWEIYALTGKPLSLGLVGLAQFLPVVSLVFVAGHAVDRFDRRRIAMICQMIEAAGAATLAVGAAMGWLTPIAIYVLVALFGAARTFEGPSLQALLPGLVPPERFSRAAALSSSLFQTATIVGPALGGLLYGLGGGIAYIAVAVAFLAASVSMATIPRPARRENRPAASLAAVFGGIAFLRSRPEILGAISLDLFAVLLGGATALLPVYARDILHAGPIGLGLLRAAPAIGALGVALWLARHPLQGRAGAKMFGAVALFGIATIVFALSSSVAVSVIALAVLGAADVVSVVIRSTLIQLRTPDEMRGRVAAVNLLFIGSSNQLGEFESGTLAALIGPVNAALLGGIGTLVVCAAGMKLFPSLRRLDRVEPEAPSRT